MWQVPNKILAGNSPSWKEEDLEIFRNIWNIFLKGKYLDFFSPRGDIPIELWMIWAPFPPPPPLGCHCSGLLPRSTAGRQLENPARAECWAKSSSTASPCRPQLFATKLKDRDSSWLQTLPSPLHFFSLISQRQKFRGEKKQFAKKTQWKSLSWSWGFLIFM